MNRDEKYSREYKDWRDRVFARDRFKCVACGSKRRRLNAHHMNSWDWCVAGRYDIRNGITVCWICHKKFHELYGRGKNYEWQFEAFLNQHHGKSLRGLL